MNLKFSARVFALALAALLSPLFVAQTAKAQEEGVQQIVDAVIAQVNNDVITLSMLKSEMDEFKEALVRQRGLTEQQAAEEVQRKQAEVIAGLINERLILQKGDEIPRLKEEVEAEVNREMLRVAAQQNIKTIEALDAAMRQSGLDPAEIRQTLRKQYMRQAVLQREVDAKIYYGLSSAELKKFFDENREKFRKPESVELSEIYLSLAGKSETEVKAKAAQIVTQARAGADFGTLAVTHSEREQDGKRIAPETKGRVGRFQVSDLRQDIAEAIKNLKAGAISDPLKTDDGYQIFRVDTRTAGSEPAFNEEQVRGIVTQERSNDERENYVRTLRKDAYIKVSPDYAEAVTPLLKVEEKTTSSTPATTPDAAKNAAGNGKSASATKKQ